MRCEKPLHNKEIRNTWATLAGFARFHVLLPDSTRITIDMNRDHTRYRTDTADRPYVRSQMAKRERPALPMAARRVPGRNPRTVPGRRPR